MLFYVCFAYKLLIFCNKIQNLGYPFRFNTKEAAQHPCWIVKANSLDSKSTKTYGFLFLSVDAQMRSFFLILFFFEIAVLMNIETRNSL